MNSEEFRHCEPEENGELLALGKSLIAAASLGDTNAVVELMKFGAPFATDWLGMTSLHHAALHGHLETCELLVRSGILKDAKSKVEKTPLHLACQEGHSHVAMFLIANGADVEAIDLIFMTPLHWAVERKHTETVDILLQNGANPWITNKFDKTCVDIALDNECEEILGLLQGGPKEGPMTVISKADSRVVDIVKKRVFPAVTTPKTMTRRGVDRFIRKKLPTPPPTTSHTKTREKDHEEMRLLLEEHGIEMLDGEDINLVASAVDSGRTVILTEAGRQALTLTEGSKSRATKGLGTLASTVNKRVPNQDEDVLASVAACSQQYMKAKKEADQLRVLYAQKKREAEECQSRLQYFALKSLKTVHGVSLQNLPLDEDTVYEGEDDEESCSA